MCGKETQLFTAVIEGSQLNVCTACGKFGKMVRRPVERVVKSPQVKKAPGPVEVVVTDYTIKIRKAREKKGMTQKEFANFLNEKESIIHKLENGSFPPPNQHGQKVAARITSYLGGS